MLEVIPLLNIVLLFGLTCSFVLCFLAIQRLRCGKPLLPFEAHPPVPWGLLAPLLLIGLFVAETSSVTAFMNQEQMETDIENLSANQLSSMLLISSTSKFLYLVVAVTCLVHLGKYTWKDLGWDARRIGPDLATGVCSFFLLVVPVFSIQAALSLFVKYEHPILNLLEADETNRFFATVFFSAVVVAPLTEEFFFRVILQGWFEKLAHNLKTRQEKPFSLTEPLSTDPLVVDLNVESDLAVEVDVESDFSTNIDSGSHLICGGAWGPILASALLFAVMHVGQGPAPIPLFVLAIGLGYIYQRTHRILACVVVHALLNGTSLLLWAASGTG